MKNKNHPFVFDEVRLSGKSGIPEVTRMIDDLKNKGWKNITFQAERTDYDECIIIEGKRPLTKKEISSLEKQERFESNQELAILKKLAKKFGYVLKKKNSRGTK